MLRISKIILLSLFFSMLIVFCSYKPAFAQDKAINALIIDGAGNVSLIKEIKEYIRCRNGRFIHSFPPYIFIGYIPANLDSELKTKFGITVYRDRIDDLASIEKYGELALSAINIWNNNFSQPVLPKPKITLSADLQSASTGLRSAPSTKLVFHWQETVGASHYRFQISPSKTFSSLSVDTIVNKTDYAFPKAFLPDGIYYWRVSALNILNQTQRQKKFSDWSEIVTFSIASEKNRQKKLPSPMSKVNISLPSYQKIKGLQLIKWNEIVQAKFYRIQISTLPTFASILIDAVSEKPQLKITSSALQCDNTYYWRIMATDEEEVSGWSNVSTLLIDFPEPIHGDVLYPPSPK